jgi:4-carboxymuconolactone decarboxylase
MTARRARIAIRFQLLIRNLVGGYSKKLIAIAIAAAHPRPACSSCQMAGAANLEVTKAEVEEALRVTLLLSGMPAYVYGKAQLDEVMK